MKNKQKLGVFFILKIIGLLIIFCTAIYTMYFLNTQGLQKTPIAELFNVPNQENWSICSKELVSFSMDTQNPKTSWKILKAQNDWRLLSNGSSETLSSKQLGKCIDRICRLKVGKIEKQELVTFNGALSYQYADSTSLIIRLNAKEKIILWSGGLYQASDLIDFLSEVPSHHCN
ncbi:MAG: hypothetical protein KDD37_00340 [Bdellovibrionales bacterium]|nr:hypothetical protein [Bdellovibrionales bacterium]